MFSFSANHLFLLSRKEYRSCAVLLLLDRDTQRVYRRHDFTKSHQFVPSQAYCVAGKVNSADKFYVVIESVRPDTSTPGPPQLLFPLTAQERIPWPESPPGRHNPKSLRRDPLAAFTCVSLVHKNSRPAARQTGRNDALLNRRGHPAHPHRFHLDSARASDYDPKSPLAVVGPQLGEARFVNDDIVDLKTEKHERVTTLQVPAHVHALVLAATNRSAPATGP